MMHKGGELLSRTGRPKSQNPHNIRHNVRIDQKTEERLTDYCKRHGLSKAVAARLAIIAMLDNEKKE